VSGQTYTLKVGNFITTYFPSTSVNKLPKIDFYVNGHVFQQDVGYTETFTVPIPDSWNIDPNNVTLVAQASDATLYAPWDPVLVTHPLAIFVSTDMNWWISRGVDAADGTPQFHDVLFSVFTSDPSQCQNPTTASPGITPGRIINVATGQGNNQGFGNLNLNTDGSNINTQPGGEQTVSLRVYANDQNIGLQVNGGGINWVNTRFHPVCGGTQYQWYAYGDRNHQSQFPLRVIGYDVTGSASRAASLPVLVAALLFVTLRLL